MFLYGQNTPCILCPSPTLTNVWGPLIKLIMYSLPPYLSSLNVSTHSKCEHSSEHCDNGTNERGARDNLICVGGQAHAGWCGQPHLPLPPPLVMSMSLKPPRSPSSSQQCSLASSLVVARTECLSSTCGVCSSLSRSA